MATFLLEVLTEEIPAAVLPSARTQLRDGFERALADAGLGGCSVVTTSTSRRLVVQIGGLPERQPDREERITGPPCRAAYADDGTPTRAAEGFARKLGIGVQELEVDSTPRGDYVAATVVRVGRPTAEILSELTPPVIGGLRFPRMMRWGRGDHQFVRPVHSVLALLEDRQVDLELLGIRSGRSTVGHRVHAPEPFELAHSRDYVAELQERQVLVSPDERREAFTARTVELVAEAGCRVLADEALVAEHVELVEYPGLLLGRFDPSYLELPRDVVITTLRHHQKCLVLEREDGSLAPYFLAVVDRRDDPEELVRQGNEWVISARLADARFFFEEDRRRRLEEMVGALEHVEFHHALGSLADKALRVGELASVLAAAAGVEAETEGLARAAALVKADLPTHLVGEFPELQGVMGGHYLRLDGEPEELWTAARDHYLPQGFDDPLPESGLGRLLGAADRMDTLAGLFAVGEIPSGSKDPFGLRRAAQGLVRIAAESGWPADLEEVARRALQLLPEQAPSQNEETRGALMSFLADRVRRYLVEVVGVEGDTADAVMAAGWTRLPDVVARARALEGARHAPEFRSLSLAFKRVRNITDGLPASGIDPTLFEQPEEEELHRMAGAFHDRLDAALAEGRFDDAFRAMGELARSLDLFFDEVLVLTDDQRVRANRIALLAGLGRDFERLADLSKLQIEGGDE